MRRSATLLSRRDSAIAQSHHAMVSFIIVMPRWSVNIIELWPVLSGVTRTRSRHIRPETGLVYKAEGGGVEDRDRRFHWCLCESPFLSVVDGVSRRRHW